MGANPRPGFPYGEGGGGSASLLGVYDRHLVVIVSLAKSLATPLAFLAGPAALIEALRRRDGVWSHCSAPAIPLIDAALRQLAWLEPGGGRLRRRLARNVRYFRQALWPLSVYPRRGCFPVQYLALPPGDAPESLLVALAGAGIRAMAVAQASGGARLLVVLRADNSRTEVRTLATALRALLGGALRFYSPAAFAGRGRLPLTGSPPDVDSRLPAPGRSRWPSPWLGDRSP